MPNSSELQKSLNEVLEKTEEAKTAYGDIQRESIELGKVFKTKQQELAEAEGNHKTSIQQVRQCSETLKILEHQAQAIEVELKQEIRKERIHELFSKQPVFEDEVARIYKEKVVGTFSGLEGFSSCLDPETCLEKIKQIDASRFPSPQTMALQAARSHYRNAITTLCEKKVDGKAISYRETEARCSPIERFILSDEIEKIWNH